MLHGSKVVEVRYAWANKGEVAAQLRAQTRRGSFMSAMGDVGTQTVVEHVVTIVRILWLLSVVALVVTTAVALLDEPSDDGS